MLREQKAVQELPAQKKIALISRKSAFNFHSHKKACTPLEEAGFFIAASKQ